MNKKLALLALTPLVLYGCAGQVNQQVPVVDSGTRLAGATGIVREVPATTQPTTPPQNEVIQVMTPPEVGMPAIETAAQQAAQVEMARAQESSRSQPAAASSAPAIASQSAQPSIEAPVLALLNTAQQQRGGGDLNGAAASLERAQRIAPREPQVLYRLAEIRLMQGDAAQAEQLAQRGLSYSAGKPALQAGLWDLIAETREKQGDDVGAAEARQKARAFM